MAEHAGQPPGGGSPRRESEIFTAWVALSDVGEADGPMQLVVGAWTAPPSSAAPPLLCLPCGRHPGSVSRAEHTGSHLWANGLLDIDAYFHHQDLAAQQAAALAAAGLGASDWATVPAVLPAGGVSVHDWRTLQ